MARRDCGVRGFLVEFGSVVDAALRGRGTGPCGVALPALHTQLSHRPQTLLPKAVRERPARSRDRWRGAAAVPGDRQPRRAGSLPSAGSPARPHSLGFHHRLPQPSSGRAYAASSQVCATRILRGKGRSGLCATGIGRCSIAFTIILLPEPETSTSSSRSPSVIPVASVS